MERMIGAAQCVARRPKGEGLTETQDAILKHTWKDFVIPSANVVKFLGQLFG